MDVNFESTIDEIDEKLNQFNTEYAVSQRTFEDFYETTKIEILENKNILARDFKDLTTNHVFRIAYKETFCDLGLELKPEDEMLDLFGICDHFESDKYSEIVNVFDITLENASIVDKLRLDDLNSEEKDNIKNLILKQENRFLLKGNI